MYSTISYARQRQILIDCERALALVESAKATEVVVEIRREDRRRAIHVRLFDVGDESGHAVGRGLLLRDITRERELDEFKTTLLAAVGHELRTPLAAIKGHASTLLQEDVTWSQLISAISCKPLVAKPIGWHNSSTICSTFRARKLAYSISIACLPGYRILWRIPLSG